jgi:hypothetical protein
MSDLVSVALITVIPGTASVIFGFLNNALARRNADQIADIQKKTDGMKTVQDALLKATSDALLKITAESEHAKGLLQGSENRGE